MKLTAAQSSRRVNRVARMCVHTHTFIFCHMPPTLLQLNIYFRIIYLACIFCLQPDKLLQTYILFRYHRGHKPDWYAKAFGHLCAAEVVKIRDSLSKQTIESKDAKSRWLLKRTNSVFNPSPLVCIDVLRSWWLFAAEWITVGPTKFSHKPRVSGMGLLFSLKRLWQ